MPDPFTELDEAVFDHLSDFIFVGESLRKVRALVDIEGIGSGVAGGSIVGLGGNVEVLSEDAFDLTQGACFTYLDTPYRVLSHPKMVDKNTVLIEVGEDNEQGALPSIRY